MGGSVTPTDDGMIIEGTGALKGAHINSHLDHRIAMAFAIAGLVAEGDTVIGDSQCVDVSYPVFFENNCTVGDNRNKKACKNNSSFLHRLIFLFIRLL